MNPGSGRIDDPKFKEIRELVQKLNDFCCENWKNPDLCKTTEFWTSLTSPERHTTLLEWLEVLGGTDKMNKTAKRYYEDAVFESQQRFGEAHG